MDKQRVEERWNILREVVNNILSRQPDGFSYEFHYKNVYDMVGTSYMAL